MMNRQNIIFLVYILAFTVLGCNKGQRKVNKIAGLWKVVSVELELEGNQTNYLFKDLDYSLSFNFFDCKLNKEDFCSYQTINRYEEGSEEVELYGYPAETDIIKTYDYRINGDLLIRGVSPEDDPDLPIFITSRILKLNKEELVLENLGENYKRTITAVRG